MSQNACYFVYESPVGERIVVDCSNYMSRYKKMAYAFVNYTRLLGLTCYKYVTLTQAVGSYKPRLLNNFFCRLRRQYGDVKYIWTAEVQKERMEECGEPVLHWHVIIAFPAGTDITPDDVVMLQQYWKYGSLNIFPIFRFRPSFLASFLFKSLLSRNSHDGVNIRRVAMSNIPPLYRYVSGVPARSFRGVHEDKL